VSGVDAGVTVSAGENGPPVGVSVDASNARANSAHASDAHAADADSSLVVTGQFG